MKSQSHSISSDASTDKVRIDKWLWAARFFKTRQLAAKAVKTGKISVNQNNCKPATTVKIGDTLRIRRGLHDMEVEIVELSEKRGPAPVAQALYRETQHSISERKRMAEQAAAQPRINFDAKKPGKRDVRSHRALKRGD